MIKVNQRVSDSLNSIPRNPSTRLFAITMASIFAEEASASILVERARVKVKVATEANKEDRVAQLLVVTNLTLTVNQVEATAQPQPVADIPHTVIKEDTNRVMSPLQATNKDRAVISKTRMAQAATAANLVDINLADTRAEKPHIRQNLMAERVPMTITVNRTGLQVREEIPLEREAIQDLHTPVMLLLRDTIQAGLLLMVNVTDRDHEEDQLQCRQVLVNKGNENAIVEKRSLLLRAMAGTGHQVVMRLLNRRLRELLSMRLKLLVKTLRRSEPIS